MVEFSQYTSLIVIVFIIVALFIQTTKCSWKSIELPPIRSKWLRGFFRNCIKGEPCSRTKDIFDKVLNDRLFLIKFRLSVFFLSRRSLCVLPHSLWHHYLSNEYENVRYRLYQLWDSSQVCRLSSFPPVIGYASWCDNNRNQIITGLDWYTIRLMLINESVAAHELIHLIQQVCDQAFDKEWNEEGIYWFRSLFYELQAHCIGSPVLFIIVVSFPVAMIVRSIQFTINN